MGMGAALVSGYEFFYWSWTLLNVLLLWSIGREIRWMYG